MMPASLIIEASCRYFESVNGGWLGLPSCVPIPRCESKLAISPDTTSPFTPGKNNRGSQATKKEKTAYTSPLHFSIPKSKNPLPTYPFQEQERATAPDSSTRSHVEIVVW